jgi:hypothetical protein
MLEFMALAPVSTAAAVALAGARAAGGATGTKFSVDPDQAEQLAKDLTAARDRLEDLAEQVRPLTEIPSPGKDMYSGMATAKIRDIAGDNPGGYLKANREARDALTSTIKNIEDALRVYRETESNAKTAMDKG